MNITVELFVELQFVCFFDYTVNPLKKKEKEKNFLWMGFINGNSGGINFLGQVVIKSVVSPYSVTMVALNAYMISLE